MAKDEEVGSNMTPRRPDFAQYVSSLFERAPFIRDLGVELVGCGPGWCETALTVTSRLHQQDGFVHAGVTTSLADHTAGGAAGTLIGVDERVLTSEYKIHFLRPGRAERMTCRATVLKPGSMLTVVEAEVRALDSLIAKMIATIAVVPSNRPRR
jgi:uncharacterized protein (TIGR00369 family)